MTKDLPPFTSTYSAGFAEFLQAHECSLAISTYQAGKVIFLSAKDRDHLVQLPRNFEKPMGIAVSGNNLAIATRDEVVLLTNSKSHAVSYPTQPHVYDNLFLPRAVYYTGEIDIHDLQWTTAGLLAVNTRFSCLAIIDHHHSFTPLWKPPFIKNLSPDDNCHLNGVAIENSTPRYVTALGTTDTPRGWVKDKAAGGILMDITTNEIILENLPMPHSPRLYNGDLYLLLSATGELVKVDINNKKYTVIRKMNGFARGMDISGDYVFIGLSKLRQTSQAFGDLPIAQQSVFCGIVVIHLPTGAITHQIKYENSVEEIYDVRVLPNMLRPGILNHLKPDHKKALSVPGYTFWSKETPDENP